MKYKKHNKLTPIKLSFKDKRNLLILSFLGFMSCGTNTQQSDGFYHACTQIDNGTTKRVLIIGDSISIGYAPFVIDTLCSEGFYVTRIIPNGKSTRYTKEHLKEWLGSKKWDVITFNEGLHDSATHTGTNLVPISEYEENLQWIAKTILEHSDKSIFFTTTVIPAHDPMNSQTDGETYNQKAIDVLTKIENLTIYDLRSVSRSIPELMENASEQNNVHYTLEGYKILANFVSNSTRDILLKL